MQIPMDAHDRVVASFPFRDKVLVITERGKVFVIEVGEDFTMDTIMVRLL